MTSTDAWRRAVAYAVLGRVPADLPSGQHLDVDELVAELQQRYPEDLDRVRSEAQGRHDWPYAVPAELREGLGYAQLAAALRLVEQSLRIESVGPVVADRPPDADERRLLADRPPHHGR